MVNGWIPTSLGDILTQERRPVVLDPEKKYAEIGVYSYGRGIFHKEPRTGFEVGNKDLYEIKQGDFIFQITFAWEGAIALASGTEDGMYGSVRFPTYRVNEDICDPKFLLNYFKTEEGLREVGRISPGSAGRNRVLATKRLPEIFVPLPPLTEQRRIVAHIESLAARVNEAQRLREEADGEAELLVGREIASLFSNANGWNSYNVGDLISEMSYGTSAKAHNERVGVPVLRMGNIQNGKLDLSDLKYMHPSEQEMNKLRLQKGDILVNRTNSAELVGKCAVFELEGDYLFASYIIRIRLDQQKADPRLVAQYINSPAGRAYMFAERKQMTGQANVNSKKLAALPISLPSLDEQRRIVAYLDGLQAKVNALRELQSQSQEELDALLPSVLDRAFKGEL